MSDSGRDLRRDLENLVSHRTTQDELAAGIPIIERGVGSKVYDIEGREYLDFVGGVTRPVAVGYGRAEIAQAMAEQAEKLHYFTPMQYSNPPPSSSPPSWHRCYPATSVKYSSRRAAPKR
ncbi:MAG: aminotransferase class III-fold pyridoxal phosphate-dependent enzyme [Thermoleophilia bacterium]|nr:aminotransferase class III-fold pyridoxal phosphate-dependent enzyme [Thermoleophilia bacterium]